MVVGTSTVSSDGAELQFIDSGAPSKDRYTTVFAIHGMCFAAPIFQKVQAAAHARGIRFVGITRRHFPGSSDLSAEQVNVVNAGSDEAKTEWLDDRGLEISTFITDFAKANSLPALSDDGSEGGIAIFGWSLGAPFAIAAISTVYSLAEDKRTLLTKNLRALFLHEPSPLAIGFPAPAQNWTHFGLDTIPFPERFMGFAQWMTGYFDHADVHSRDYDKLTWCVPSYDRLPSIYNMDHDFIKKHLLVDEKSALDLIFCLGFEKQMFASHRATFYDPALRQLFSHMKISLICGTRAPGWAPSVIWNVQDEEKELGKVGSVITRFIEGGNHFTLWDEPERMVDEFEKCIAA